MKTKYRVAIVVLLLVLNILVTAYVLFISFGVFFVAADTGKFKISDWIDALFFRL